MDTALSYAFHKAGVRSAEDRLREIALKAMVEHADNTFATVDAIWAEVQRSPTLMSELFKYSYRREIGTLIHMVRQDIEVAERNQSLKRSIERKAAVALQTIRAEEHRQKAEYDARNAASIKAYQAGQESEAQKWLAKWQATPIGSLSISGKPVWQNSAGTVRAWLATEKRRWRTIELLIEGLPDDGRPIEYYRKPHEVEALWLSAGDGERQ